MTEEECALNESRARTEALDNVLGQEFKVLNSGFIRVIDYMGNDNAVVQAARVSYGKGTKGIRSDKALINYLMRHNHTSPFEMCEIKFHIKLPIFVARQWIRHRTASVNEYSARYSILDKEFYLPESIESNDDYYIPEHDVIKTQNGENKQGRDHAGDVSDLDKEQLINYMASDSNHAYEHYEWMLERGISRELARVNLGVNFYTQWYWKIDLHNLMHFLKLRIDSKSQYEIRVYADVMLDLMSRWVPFTYEAFLKYKMHAISISSVARDALQRLLNGEKVSAADVDMSAGEWKEFVTAFNLDLAYTV